MRATLRHLPLAFSLSLLFSAASFAQTSMIEGDIKGEDGKPVVGAQVVIERTDIHATYRVRSDKKGHYLYAGLPLGTFNITVFVDGQLKDGVKGVPTHPGDPIEVPFDLAKSAAAHQPGAPAAQPSQADAERGMSKAQKEDYEKKLAEQKKQMESNKALQEAFNAGREAEDAKNYQAAIDSYNKAVELGPTQHVIWGHMADSYTALSKTQSGADQQASYDKAIAAYQKAIELKADDPAYHNNYAIALALDKKLDDAQVELTKAAQLDPPNAGKYYYNLGAVLVNTNQMEAAGAAFKKAIDATPDYADAHYQYGLYLVAKATTTPDGKILPPEGTLNEFQKYLDLDPNGHFSTEAKAMIQTLGGSIDTSYNRPGAKKTTTTKK